MHAQGLAGHVRTQVQVCTKVYSRHTFAHVSRAETPCPSSSDPRSYLNMFFFGVYTETDGCGVWRLLSLLMPPVWRGLTKHTVLSLMQRPLGFPLYRCIPTDSVSWAQLLWKKPSQSSHSDLVPSTDTSVWSRVARMETGFGVSLWLKYWGWGVCVGGFCVCFFLFSFFLPDLGYPFKCLQAGYTLKGFFFFFCCI